MNKVYNVVVFAVLMVAAIMAINELIPFMLEWTDAKWGLADAGFLASLVILTVILMPSVAVVMAAGTAHTVITRMSLVTAMGTYIAIVHPAALYLYIRLWNLIPQYTGESGYMYYLSAIALVLEVIYVVVMAAVVVIFRKQIRRIVDDLRG